MTAVGKTGKEWRKVDPEEVKEWRRLVVEERKSYRAVGRMFGREHGVIQYHVSERPEGGPVVVRPKGWKKQRKPRTIESALINILTMARGRSKVKGMDFELTLPMIMNLYNQQEGRCLLTGIPFELEKPKQARTGAFSPSIDRIDSKRGYTIDNIRLVIWGINLGLGQWGEEIYAQIAEAYITKQKEYKENEISSHIS
jgi:hypothetical protein